MNVLIHSRVFLPSFGGLEKMMDLIAEEVAAAGHNVTVVTMTPASVEPIKHYTVIRRPTGAVLIKAALRADVCLVANITLRTTPLLLLLGRKVITSHQGWYPKYKGRRVLGFLKNTLSHFTENIFCSHDVERHISGRGLVIPNSYAEDIFNQNRAVSRDRDFVFVGRLVSDKGCDVLLEAVAALKRAGVSTNLTIVGEGEEASVLKACARDLELGERVEFTGKLEGEELAAMISRHRVLVVPSKWEEPFGIVALEGAACGCAVIGTDGGGLPEAIGPCGIVVRRGDVEALADGMKRLLFDSKLLGQCLASAPAHLARHNRSTIGKQYTDVLKAAAAGRSVRAEQQT